MYIKAISSLLFLGLALTGCGGANVLTQEEVEIQSRADEVLALTLFEQDLDTNASYNVRKDGYVVIKFDKSVPENIYTNVVETLRASADIRGVRAEQDGVEVCPLR